VVDEICKHNIDHVTITINCVDPEIGAKIYPWIFWNNRRIKGVKAAKILIEQQQKGLQMLCDRGVLVKVNSVMIPGVNDEHLKEVSRVVKAKGAFLHNVMPLIAEAEHGTFYGMMGQRGPNNDELQALQDECAGDMAMMRHCRQCRADAVGMLGEDRGAEFTNEKVAAMDIDYEAAMLRRADVHAAIEANRSAQQQQRNETFIPITSLKRTKQPAVADTPPALFAVATTGGGVINEHFGHAREFLVYEAAGHGETVDVRFIGARKVDLYCSGGDTCGDAEDALAKTIRTLDGCTAVLCSKIGIEPWDRLEAAGLVPNGEHAMEPIEDAVAALYRELLAEGRLDVPAASTALSA
jgi:nitrogen fixation protein NifB